MSYVLTYEKRRIKVWLWIVCYWQIKQIVAFQLGYLGIKTCWKLRKKLMEIGIKGKLHTDLWKAYVAVFPKHQQIAHEKKV